MQTERGCRGGESREKGGELGWNCLNLASMRFRRLREKRMGTSDMDSVPPAMRVGDPSTCNTDVGLARGDEAVARAHGLVGRDARLCDGVCRNLVGPASTEKGLQGKSDKWNKTSRATLLVLTS